MRRKGMYLHFSVSSKKCLKMFLSLFQTCPMKGRPEQSFLDQFSERFMDHVRQVNKEHLFLLFSDWSYEWFPCLLIGRRAKKVTGLLYGPCGQDINKPFSS
jgi:hypothetical protein